MTRALPTWAGGFPFDAVSFDVDGTLYSLGWFKWTLLWRRLRDLRAWMALETARKAIRRAATPHDDMAAHVAAAVAADLREPIDQVRARLDRMIDVDWPLLLARVGPLPGAVPLLDALVAARIPIVALSDYPGLGKLRGLGLDHYPWRAVIDATALGALKPHPRAFQAALDTLNLPAPRVLHIGDSPELDVAGAASVGMASALIGRPRRPSIPTPDPTFTFPSMHHLQAAVSSALSRGATAGPPPP